MTSTTIALATVAEDNAFLNSNQNKGSSFVEPEMGRRAALRFIEAVNNGLLESTDAWALVCSHLGRLKNRDEDPRLRGFINELARSATAVEAS